MLWISGLTPSQHGAYDSVTDFSVHLNTADAQNVVGIFALKAKLNMGWIYIIKYIKITIKTNEITRLELLILIFRIQLE